MRMRMMVLGMALGVRVIEYQQHMIWYGFRHSEEFGSSLGR